MSQGYRVTMQSMEWKGLLVTQLCQVSVPVSMQFCWVECLSFPCKPRQSFKTLQYFPAPTKQPRKNCSHPPHPSKRLSLFLRPFRALASLQGRRLPSRPWAGALPVFMFQHKQSFWKHLWISFALHFSSPWHETTRKWHHAKQGPHERVLKSRPNGFSVLPRGVFQMSFSITSFSSRGFGSLFKPLWTHLGGLNGVKGNWVPPWFREIQKFLWSIMRMTLFGWVFTGWKHFAQISCKDFNTNCIISETGNIRQPCKSASICELERTLIKQRECHDVSWAQDWNTIVWLKTIFIQPSPDLRLRMWRIFAFGFPVKMFWLWT